MQLYPILHTPIITRVQYGVMSHITVLLCHGYTSQLWAKGLRFVCALFVNCSSNNHNWLVLAKQYHIARLMSLRQEMCILTLRVTDDSST